MVRVWWLMWMPLVLSAAEEIRGPATVLDILGAAFPTMMIREELGRTIDDSWRMDDALFFPDALAKEPVYIISGSPVDDLDRCAASNVVTGTTSRRRELRMKPYAWPDWPDDILAVVQYRFPDAAPPGTCESVARLLHLERHGGKLRTKENLPLVSTHHRTLNGIQLADLDGDAIEELIIESDSGGGGIHGSDLVVFSLRERTFKQWLNVPSRLHVWHADEREYAQTLDIVGTLSEHAGRFCFTKTTFAIDGQRLPKPETSQPCYPRFTGPSAKGDISLPVKK